MAARSEIELLENAAVRLKVTVPKDEVKGAYDDLVKEHCRTASVRGFRKGRVPAPVLIRKYGESLKEEAATKLIEKGLQEILETIEQKPLNYSIPELKEQVQLELESAFTFEVTYDTFPEITVGKYQDIEAQQPVVEVAEEDIDRELDVIRDQNALVVDKPDGKIEEGDTVTIDYVEVDEKGDEIENTRREGFTFGVGTGYNLYKIDEEIVGLEKGEEKVIEKSYAEDFEYSELAGRTVSLKVKVTSVKEKQVPELNDELAQDVSDEYKTLDDLKKDIRKRLEEALTRRIREHNVSAIIRKIVEDSTVPLPRSMTERDLSIRWLSFLRQLRADESTVLRMLKNEGRSREALYEEWRPGVEEGLKAGLIIHKLSEVEKIAVSDEELDEEIKKEAENQKRKFEELKGELSQRNLLETMRDNIMVRKVHDMLLDSAKITKGKKTKFLDFMRGNN
jgi:trigger factor